MNRIKIRPLNKLEFSLDAILYPVMRVLAPRSESIQRTHRWNNHHLDRSLVSTLDVAKCALVFGDQNAISRRAAADVRFHSTRLGGWKQFVVLGRTEDHGEPWYVGWLSSSVFGVSRYRQEGYCRCLRGSDDVLFFALNEHSEQIDVTVIARGAIGDGGPYRQIPLY